MSVPHENLINSMQEQQWKELIDGLKGVLKDGKKIIKKEKKIENIFKHYSLLFNELIMMI
jgi:hypothetical protein